MKRGWWILKFAVIVVVFAFGLTFITMYLWNWLVPELFSGPMISFWQAAGLLILTKIITWGFGRRRGNHHWGYSQFQWRDKWKGMSDEEREKFRQKMMEKCSWGKSTQVDSTMDQPS